MTATELAAFYRAYLDCLNRRDFDGLGAFVADGAKHNGRAFGLSGYRAMLERDVAEIPDLVFRIQLLVTEPPRLAARLVFDCTPAGTFLGLPVNGRRVHFHENVVYEVADGRIVEVWSVIDKAAIEAQL